MSHVTDLIFIIPNTHYTHDLRTNAEYRLEFEDIFESLHGWRPKPVETSPTPDKGWLSDVYVIGVNYLKTDLPGKLEERSWPSGTVLWLHTEFDEDTGVRIHRYGPILRTEREAAKRQMDIMLNIAEELGDTVRNNLEGKETT